MFLFLKNFLCNYMVFLCNMLKNVYLAKRNFLFIKKFRPGYLITPKGRLWMLSNRCKPNNKSLLLQLQYTCRRRMNLFLMCPDSYNSLSIHRSQVTGFNITHYEHDIVPNMSHIIFFYCKRFLLLKQSYISGPRSQGKQL